MTDSGVELNMAIEFKELNYRQLNIGRLTYLWIGKTNTRVAEIICH
jgi:hypothetical protein